MISIKVIGKRGERGVKERKGGKGAEKGARQSKSVKKRVSGLASAALHARADVRGARDMLASGGAPQGGRARW